MKSTRIILITVFIVEGLFALYGLNFELNAFPALKNIWKIKEEMGMVIFLVSLAMGVVAFKELMTLNQDGENQQRLGMLIGHLQTMAGAGGYSLAVHERDFYEQWREQVIGARYNVDITHLGVKQPSLRGAKEKKYYEDLKRLVKTSQAEFRRVERFSPDKTKWIKGLIKDYKGCKNYSLAIYTEPVENTMPQALSISRIDTSHAWLVAMAEHQSTIGVRDILITHPKAIDILIRYYETRLWNRSEIILRAGVIDESVYRKFFSKK